MNSAKKPHSEKRGSWPGVFIGKRADVIDGVNSDGYVDGSSAFHPLRDHLCDVACTMQALLAIPAFRRALDRAAGRCLTQQQVDRLVVLAALHDVGKYSMSFLSKFVSWLGIKGGHVKESLMLLHEPFVQKFTQAVDWRSMATWGENEEAMIGLLLASWSHHGEPISINDPDYPRDHAIWKDVGDIRPFEAITELMQRLQTWFPLAFLPGGDPLPDSAALQHLFAGLVTLADWTGSNPTHFTFSKPDGADRFYDMRKFLPRFLSENGIDVRRELRAVAKRNPSFKSVCGVDPRPLQAFIEGFNPAIWPQIMVLEDETGAGKTEAAFWWFVRLFLAGQVNGMYFALPTRTSATQIHARTTRLSESLFAPDESLPVVLAVPGYFRVGDANGRGLPGHGVLWDDKPEGRRLAGRWAASDAKRFLAAPIAVGTVDQSFLSSVKVNHAHVRASVMPRSLLVVDEVHASDPYMRELLHATVKTQKGHGGFVLLLSATLGGEFRTQLLQENRRATVGYEEAVATPYPAASWAHQQIDGTWKAQRQNIERPVDPVSGTQQTKRVKIKVARIMEKPAAIAELALDHAARGARVLVIRNTVGAAVETQKAMERIAAERNQMGLLFAVEVGGKSVPTVHHSRYSAPDRRTLDLCIEGALGKNSTRSGVAIVGTQTVEQSLDIDADLLISDLCPADVLLQRFGRGHRHADRIRPSGYEELTAVVLTPGKRDLTPFVLTKETHRLGIGNVYTDILCLEATYRQLEKRPVLHIPQDNRAFVEAAVHSEALNQLAIDLGPYWLSHRKEIWGDYYARIGIARQVLVQRDELFTGDKQRLCFGEMGVEAATRLGQKDHRVVFPNALKGPFGDTVKELKIAGWLVECDDPEAQPTAINPIAYGFTFSYGGQDFLYGRHGLVKN